MNRLYLIRRSFTAILVLTIVLVYLFCIALVLMPSVYLNFSVSSLSSNDLNHSQDSQSNQRSSLSSSSNILFHRRRLKNQDSFDYASSQTYEHEERELKTISTNQSAKNKSHSSKISNNDPHPQNLTLSLNDIFISVKTTRIFHKSRLDLILDTWYQLAKKQTYFFTDTTEDEYKSRLGEHLVNTNCSVSHNRKALCCKMSVEYDFFIQKTNKKWWCHFDDDNYVNIPKLVNVLQRFDPLYDWYLGKTSIKQPLEIYDRQSKKRISFSFATGGAGFCVSRALALKMMPVASDGRLISVGEKIRLPDDVTIGYIIEHILAKNLTLVEEFHSHLEPMAMLKKETLNDQVSFSYSGNKINRNVLNIPSITSSSNLIILTDPTRFYALHCHLFSTLCKTDGIIE